jgi:hypothetical protein
MMTCFFISFLSWQETLWERYNLKHLHYFIYGGLGEGGDGKYRENFFMDFG